MATRPAAASVSFRRILCPIDFSAESLQALRAAAELARLHRGTLLVFHVVDALSKSADVIVTLVSEATAAMDALIDAEGSHLTGVRYTTEVTSGEVFAEILERADSWNADLIVVDPTGEATLIEKILGRTSERIVKGAHCSVMIVRPAEPRAAEEKEEADIGRQGDRPPIGSRTGRGRAVR